MARQDGEVTIGANLSALRKQLESIPDMTAAEAKRMTIALEREINAQKKAAREAAKATARATKQASREAERAARDAERAMVRAAREAEREWDRRMGDIETAANTAFGETIGDVLDLGRGLGALGPHGAAAAVAIGGIAVAGAAGATAIIGIVTAADEAVDRLTELQGVDAVSPETRARIDGANDAMAALGVVADELLVVLGDDLAPVVDLVAGRLVTLGLRGVDMAEDWLSTKSILEEIAVWMGSGFIQALLTPVTAVAQVSEGLGWMLEQMGWQDNALSQVGQGYDDWTADLARAGLGVADLGEGIGETSTEAESLIAKIRAKRLATQAAAQADEAAAQAVRSHAEAMAELDRLYEANLAAEDALDKIRGKAISDLQTQRSAIAATTHEQIGAVDQVIAKLREQGASEEQLADKVEWAEQVKAEIRARAARDLAAVEAEEAAERQARAQEVTEAVAGGLARIEALSVQAHDSELARIASETQAKLDALQQETSALLEHEGLTEEQRTAIRAAAVQERAQIEAEGRAKIRAANEQMVQDEIANAMQVASAYMDGVSSMGEAFAGFVDGWVGDSENLTEGQKKAARTAFAIQQAAAMGQAVMNTANAITMAASAAPPPLNVPLIAMAAATGAAQVSTIAMQEPPQFALGGIIPPDIPRMPGSADHGYVAASGGEGILTRQAVEMLGEQGVADLNRGQMPTPTVVVENRYKHKVFDSFVADNIAKGGPLRDAVTRPRRTGHSRRRR